MIFSVKERVVADRQAEIQQLRAIMSRAATGMPIVSAYLHGSVAQNRDDEHSDVDIALFVLPEISVAQSSKLELDLELALIKHAVHEPDVRVINLAPLEAKARIIQSGILLFSGDEMARLNLEQEILRALRTAQSILREQRASYVAQALSRP